MASFTERMLGAAKLDVRTYEEVEADQNATGQAMAVVVLASVAAGIGQIGQSGIFGLIAGAIVALIGWFIWAFLTYIIGTKFLPEPQTRSDMGELLRTIGFASSPGLLRVLGAIPGIGPLISLAIAIWMLVAFVIAVRQALDYRSTGRAVLVCVVGFVVYLVSMVFLVSILAALFGFGAAAVSG
ncbi:MAG: YIP1 family protein [Terriglobia bacterium]